MNARGRRIGVFGGTFDPPHLGHVIVAQECLWQRRLDEVLLVVSARPPHRAAPRVDAEIRLRMVAAAVEGFPGLRASRVEIDREGPSYTADTLERLQESEPGAEISLIIGADQLLAFGTWRDPQRITAVARLAVVARGSADLDAVADAGEHIAPGSVDLVAMPAVEISSTMIRDRVRNGDPYAHLVPRPVADIVAAEHLYRSA